MERQTEQFANEITVCDVLRTLLLSKDRVMTTEECAERTGLNPRRIRCHLSPYEARPNEDDIKRYKRCFGAIFDNLWNRDTQIMGAFDVELITGCAVRATAHANNILTQLSVEYTGALDDLTIDYRERLQLPQVTIGTIAHLASYSFAMSSGRLQ